MLELLGRNWWILAIRGTIAILFGILAFAQPELTLAVLVTLLAAYLIADGVSLLAAYVRGEPGPRRRGWSVAVMGVLGIGLGIAAFVWPDITALWLLSLVAVWAIPHGHLPGASRPSGCAARSTVSSCSRSGASSPWPLVRTCSSIRGRDLLSLVWLVGLWAIAFGIVNLALAFRLRSLRTAATGRGAEATL